MIIYCTAAERELLDSLPKDLTNDCDVREETLTYADTPASMRERMSLMKLKTPKLVEFQKHASALTSEDAVEALLAQSSSMAITEDELLDICFGLGPAPLTDLIVRMLSAAEHHNDIASAAAMTELRHMALVSLQSVPPLV